MKLHNRSTVKRIVITGITGLLSTFALMVFFKLGPSPVTAQPAESLALSASPRSALENEGLEKVEPAVFFELAAYGKTDFFIWLAEQADLSRTAEIKPNAAKGEFVYNTLQETAARAQNDIRRLLSARGSETRPFYIANKILVRGGDLTLLREIAARPDVARITANHQYQIPELLDLDHLPAQPQTVEDNLVFVNADDVWALGITGQGIVLAGNDSGIDETHPAIARHYRGCLNPPTCSLWDHNYNWWDATGTYPTNPGDGHFHGTWTTGIMVGDDGGTNQIGIAPGSQTIHCKFYDDQGVASDATISECLEWDLAPWDLNGLNPRPDLAPHAVNSSWGYKLGGQDQFKDEIRALKAAGILVTAIAGNQGPACSTLLSPGDDPEVFTVGSVSNVGSLPGTLSSFSSRGPSDLAGSPPSYFPEIMAPGEFVRSSIPFPIFNILYLPAGSGTSASGPHVTGLIGLVWSACPNLKGMVDTTVALIKNTAVPLSGQAGSSCGGDYATGPNNDWGYGTIDALAAVQRAQAICGDRGHLDGNIYDAVTLNPVVEATITAEQALGGTWRANSGPTGYYTITTFHGTYTVTTESYGYFPATVAAVSVLTGSVTTQNFFLTSKPEHLISGTVLAAGTGQPLSATLTASSTPLLPVVSNPATGYYEISVAEGVYELGVTATGYDTARRVISADQAQTQDFVLDPRPCILLVEDDRPNDYDTLLFYTTALGDLGYDFDTFPTGFSPENGPTSSQLRDYRMVIWFSGDTRNDFYGAAGPNATDEGHLAAYLDHGGSLFLSSQDYLYAWGMSAFGEDYLGISSYINDVNRTDVVGTPGDPVGDGLGPYNLVPPSSWVLTTDQVSGVQASPFQWFGTGQTNSTSYISDTFRTVFLGWPLEGLTNLSDRSAILGQAIDWLGGCEAEYQDYLPMILRE